MANATPAGGTPAPKKKSSGSGLLGFLNSIDGFNAAEKAVQPERNALSHTAKSVANDAGAVGGFLTDLTKGSTWLRVGEFIGGAILIIFALFMFGRVVENGNGGSRPRTRVVPVPA